VTFTRRRFLQSAAYAAVATTRPAWAQSYPTRPVRIVSGYPPGGVVDTYARLIGASLSARLGQQFIVENRPGAGGTIAAQEVAKAAPDGYTLLLTTSADAWNASLYGKLNFDVLRDFVQVAPVARDPGVVIVNPSLPDKSIPELIADAKSHPGKITVGTAGVGSAPYMYWALFHSATGADMVEVPYHGGGPALTDLLGGRIEVYFSTFPAAIEYIKAGKVRALGVTSTARSPLLPDVPTLAEFLPGYEANIYVGIAAPRGTPAAIVDELNAAIGVALTDATFTKRVADLGDTPLKLSSSDFAKLVTDETAKWRKVIREAGIKAE
jgi:tripartite-type tricarboxylate transporter receptor subunit TctC